MCFDEIKLQEEARALILENAKEHLEEFKNAKLAEVDDDFYTFAGDKHYFEFELEDNELILNTITEIIYFD